MKKDIFIVRSNITPAVERMEQLAKEREERERAERDAKWAREREERERAEAEWKKEHPILDKFTYISHYNYKSYSWPGDVCNIRFYEWSNINSEPKFFTHTIGFYIFLDDCKINLTEAQNSKIKANMGCHITCIPNTHDLVIGTSYESLKSQFNTAKVLSSVPELNPSPVIGGLPAVANNRPKVLSCEFFEGPIDYA